MLAPEGLATLVTAGLELAKDPVFDRCGGFGTLTNSLSEKLAPSAASHLSRRAAPARNHLRERRLTGVALWERRRFESLVRGLQDSIEGFRHASQGRRLSTLQGTQRDK